MHVVYSIGLWYRYYAVIPLAMMIVVTLIGMIVDGYLHITYWNQDHYGDQRYCAIILHNSPVTLCTGST